MQSDASYFSQRVEEEVKAATSAILPTERRAHLDLAERYADIAEAIIEHDGSLAWQPEPEVESPAEGPAERFGIWL